MDVLLAEPETENTLEPPAEFRRFLYPWDILLPISIALWAYGVKHAPTHPLGQYGLPDVASVPLLRRTRAHRGLDRLGTFHGSTVIHSPGCPSRRVDPDPVRNGSLGVFGESVRLDREIHRRRPVRQYERSRQSEDGHLSRTGRDFSHSSLGSTRRSASGIPSDTPNGRSWSSNYSHASCSLSCSARSR